MKQRRRAFFLPVILAAGLLLGACNTPVKPESPVVVTYGVTLDANGGSGTMEPIIGVTDEYVLPECSFTAPTGKRFTGWKVDGQGDLLKPGAKINLTANIKLVAQWELIKYTVSFDANGGTGTITTIGSTGEVTVRVKEDGTIRINDTVKVGQESDAPLLEVLPERDAGASLHQKPAGFCPADLQRTDSGSG